MKKLKAKLNARLAEKAFASAQNATFLNQSDFRLSLVAAHLIAIVILLLPIAVIAGGVYLMTLSFPAPAGIILGAMLVLLGWALLPRRARVPKTALTQNDLPKTFAFVDRVTKTLDAPKVDRIVLDTDFNAYVFEAHTLGGTSRILGLGLPLWGALNTEQKVALLGHEIGHLVNRDPGRTTTLLLAKDTLERWLFWFQPAASNPYAERHLGEILMDFVLALFGEVVGLIWLALHWTMMYHSQIAEYVADAKSAEVAGLKAARETVQMSLLGPEVPRALRALHMFDKPKDGWIIDHVADKIIATSQDRKNQYFKRAESEKSSVDASHPPTIYRLAFIDHLPNASPKILLNTFESLGIDAELQPYKDVLGAELVTELGASEY